jgi:hypothetical protein
MSDNTLDMALRIMGRDTGSGGDHCAHGFRSTASTLLNEEGAFDDDVMEAQLARNTKKKTRQRRQEQDPQHLYRLKQQFEMVAGPRNQDRQ